MRTLNDLGQTKVTPGFPNGAILPFYGTSIPSGWALCDGTGGTPDLRDRFLVGDTAVSTGSAAGSTSATAALTHSGMTVDDHAAHVVTQPANHSNHIVTQPSNHSAHGVTEAATHATHTSAGGHTHDAHTTATRTAAGLDAEVTSPGTHNSEGAHTHDAHTAHTGTTVDAHSAHSGMTVDAHSAHTGAAVDAHSVHSVGQASNHSILKHYLLVFIMKVTP